jgi:hypothetical protein
MGLDMYLYRREYLSNYSWGSEHDNEKSAFHVIADAIGIQPCGGAPHIQVEVCVAYWRKANAIHKWFCDLDGGRDECQNIYVTRKNLVELSELCRTALLHPAMAASVLPTQPGFFFGSTDYDEWYMEDMKNTVAQLDKVLESVPEGSWNDFIYRSSW